MCNALHQSEIKFEIRVVSIESIFVKFYFLLGSFTLEQNM